MTVYEPRSTASHIRHESAVRAGDAGNANLLINFFQKELAGEDSRKEKIALQFFEKTFGEELTKDQQKIMQIFTRKNSIRGWFQKVFYPRRLRTRLGGELALRFLFFIGKI